MIICFKCNYFIESHFCLNIKQYKNPDQKKDPGLKYIMLVIRTVQSLFRQLKIHLYTLKYYKHQPLRPRLYSF